MRAIAGTYIYYVWVEVDRVFIRTIPNEEKEALNLLFLLLKMKHEFIMDMARVNLMKVTLHCSQSLVRLVETIIVQEVG